MSASIPGSNGLPPGTAVPGGQPPSERQQLLDQLAETVCRRGFGTPAVFLLESVRPLNFIGSQLLYALGPVASLVIDRSKWEGFAEALEDRETIDQLISNIEAREAKP